MYTTPCVDTRQSASLFCWFLYYACHSGPVLPLDCDTRVITCTEWLALDQQQGYITKSLCVYRPQSTSNQYIPSQTLPDSYTILRLVVQGVIKNSSISTNQKIVLRFQGQIDFHIVPHVSASIFSPPICNFLFLLHFKILSIIFLQYKNFQAIQRRQAERVLPQYATKNHSLVSTTPCGIRTQDLQIISQCVPSKVQDNNNNYMDTTKNIFFLQTVMSLKCSFESRS